MNKLIHAHIGGKAFQMEEAAYDLAQTYLKRAAGGLKADADRPEVLAGLEQAIADKLAVRLGAYKDVVTATDMADVLAVLGPVKRSADAAASGVSDGASALRRFHAVPDGALVSGVCNGFAAYFGVDVVLVRIAFLMLAVFTGGSMVLVYAVLALTLPKATTPERLAQAYGRPLTAPQVREAVKERTGPNEGSRYAVSPRRPVYLLVLAGIIVVALASVSSLQRVLMLVVNPFGYRGGALSGLYDDRFDVLPLVVPYLFIWPLVYLAQHNGPPRQGRHHALVSAGGWLLWLAALASVMLPALFS